MTASEQGADVAPEHPGVALALLGTQGLIVCALFLDELGGLALTPDQTILLQFYVPPVVAFLAGLLAPSRWTFAVSLAAPAIVAVQMALTSTHADDTPESLGILLGIGLVAVTAVAWLAGAWLRWTVRWLWDEASGHR